jgi:hypothetical protein
MQAGLHSVRTTGAGHVDGGSCGRYTTAVRVLAPVVVSALALAGCATGYNPRGLFDLDVPQPWVEARGRRVTLYMDGDVDDAPEILQELEIRVDALARAFLVDPSRLSSINVILFDRQRDYDRIAPRQSAGFQHDGNARSTIVMFGVWDDDRRATATHEIAHDMIGRAYGKVPAWLNEGLAQFFQTMVLEESSIVVGTPPRGATDRAGMPSLEALITGRDAAFYGKGLDLNYFDFGSRQAYAYRMAWMVTHYLMTTEGPMRARFDDYLGVLATRRSAPSPSVSLFAGQDLAALERTILEQYSYRAVPGMRMPYTPPPPVEVKTRPWTRDRVPL